MCDKRFMPKNRSNVGKNVTINLCISTLISFSAFKKDCPSSTSSVCQTGGTHKCSWYVGLTPAPTIYPNIYIYISGISGIPKHILNFINPQKQFHYVPWLYETTIKYIGMTSKNNPKIFLPQIIFIFDPLPTETFLNFKILNPQKLVKPIYVYIRVPPPRWVQLRSQNAWKVTHNKGRLLNEVILFNCATFWNGNFS